MKAKFLILKGLMGQGKLLSPVKFFNGWIAGACRRFIIMNRRKNLSAR